MALTIRERFQFLIYLLKSLGEVEFSYEKGVSYIIADLSHV